MEVLYRMRLITSSFVNTYLGLAASLPPIKRVPEEESRSMT